LSCSFNGGGGGGGSKLFTYEVCKVFIKDSRDANQSRLEDLILVKL
jgi:hypothetical protein